MKIKLTVLLTILVLSGCFASREASFFLLSSTTTKSENNCLKKIGVGPIELPTYLERPQIVARRQDNQIEVDEFNRWGEPLNETIASVVAINIARSLGTSHIELYPFRNNDQLDYQVVFDIIRFEYLAKKQSVHLLARWSIQDMVDKTILERGVIDEFIDSGPTRIEQVGVMSNLIGNMSDQVAKAIESM